MTPRAPSIPEAERLEQVRLDYLNRMPLARFHRLLTNGQGYRVSYAAVRNYHSHRKAPVDYYAQVARTFGIRLEWLLFGEGEMTPALEATRGAQRDEAAWLESLPAVAPTIWDPSDHVSRAALLDCLERLDRARPGIRPLSPDQKLQLAKVLDTLVGGTLWILRGDRRVPRSFVRAILIALSEGIPEPRHGSTYRGILKRMKMGNDEG